MEGLIWTIVVWGALFALARAYRDRFPLLKAWFSRENLALVVALLGTYSIAAQTDAEQVLRQPLALERILRGGLAAAALALVAPLLIQRLRTGYTRGHRAMMGVLVYLIVAGISTVYSAAPLVTAAKVGEITAGLAPIVTVALGERPAEQLRNTLYMVMALAASLVAVAVVGFVLFPSQFARLQSRPGFVFAETMVSPYAHSNSLAAHGAFVSVFCLAARLQRLFPARLCTIVGIVTAIGVVLASGRQGVAIFLAGAAVVLWAQRRAIFLILLAPATAGAIYMFRDELFSAIARDRPGNFTDFTGRLYWWEAAMEAWSSHPWTGWGYAAGGRFVALASVGRSSTSSVHSGFVEALVGVGVIGSAALLYALYRVVVWSIRHLKTETALAVLVGMLILRTVVSPGFGGWLNVEFVLFALLAAIADRSSIDARARSRSETRTPATATI